MSLFDDDLSPDLRALFDAERRRDERAPPGAQDRVRAALSASIGVGLASAAGGAGAAKAAAAAGAAGAGKAAGAVAGGGAVVTASSGAAGAAAGGAATAGGVTAAGGALAKGLAFALVAAMAGTAGTGVYLAQKDDEPAAAPAAVVVEPSPASDAAGFDPSILGRKPAEPPPLEDKPRPRVKAPVVVDAPPSPRVSARPVETPEEKAARLTGERTILDDARAAVGRGDGGAALIALEAHREQYPDGALVEEREALTVLALAKLGRADEAREKAARFRARFPSSLMLVAVDAAAPP